MVRVYVNLFNLKKNLFKVCFVHNFRNNSYMDFNLQFYIVVKGH